MKMLIKRRRVAKKKYTIPKYKSEKSMCNRNGHIFLSVQVLMMNDCFDEMTIFVLEHSALKILLLYRIVFEFETVRLK